VAPRVASRRMSSVSVCSLAPRELIYIYLNLSLQHINVVVQKCQPCCAVDGEGRDGSNHAFKKPLFMTFLSFVAMVGMLPLPGVLRYGRT
jgi:hypothetical protein